ncbi:MAG TPA: RcnB family protein [Rhizomicrobium sp.]|nr:RcnB family protein [Rhizomicrobium sp.]
MRKLLITTAMFAALAGSAMAQDETTTTTVQTPDSTRETTVTKSPTADGGYMEYRKTVTSSHHFSIGPWSPPSDYVEHKFALGDRLPADLMADAYYIDNYGSYALVAPPDGTVWVRVGADAFLVRRDDGEIIQADYSMFN